MMTRMMKKMSGNTPNFNPEINRKTMNELFAQQVEFQKKVTGASRLPKDDVSNFQYHVVGLMEEVGEVLKTDKRWKTHRNKQYVVNEKLDELADLFIECMNLVIFSGYSIGLLLNVIERKIQINNERFDKENGEE